jgi:Flp pilus assembly protein TadG
MQMVIKQKKERGAALIEAAVTIPIILLITVAVFDLGKAYQTWQVLTNAAREGARVSVIASKTDDQVRQVVEQYVEAGRLPVDSTHALTINLERSIEFGGNNASRITVSYGFKFMVLGPIMKMVDDSSDQSNAVTIGAVAVMRNEN